MVRVQTGRHYKGANFRTVWRTLQEIGKTTAQIEENRKKVNAELAELRKKNDAELAELRKETEIAHKEAEIAHKEAEIAHKEAEIAHKEAEKAKEELDKKLGEMTNRFGELAEHLVAPGIIKRFNELGYHFDDIIAQNVIIQDGQGRDLAEIDLLCENGEYSLAAEVKSYPVLKDIPHHTKRLEIFRAHKNRRGDKRIIRGAIAGAVFSEDVRKAALDAGFYVIVQSGDTMKIRVPEGFKPKDF